MERVVNSLRVRLISVVLIILAALAPLLYLGVSAIVEAAYAERFVNSVRAYSRLAADELETLDPSDFDRRARALLDSIELSGQAVFAEISDGSRKLHSTIGSPVPTQPMEDDFNFGDHGDQVYYISHTVKRPERTVVLQLGFDETPTLEQIRAAKRQLLIAMAVFAVTSLALATWLSAVIARPMVRLQEAAKRVAGGDVHAPLQMQSSIREIHELNHHLERMRQELVGTNEQLSLEIRERKASDQKRLALERRLLHRERIAAIGTLAGGVAHEFNNIMTPILLYAQLALESTPPDSELSKDLSRVVAAAHRARNLVTRILTFSREMDSPQVGAFSAEVPVAEALALLRAIVPTNIEIVFNAPQQEIRVQGDPSLVQQIVMNLGTNAYQAMRDSGGKLGVSLRLAEPAEGIQQEGGYCVLEVTDSGHGIEPALLAHIFEPFFTTREVGEGTGLGLSVVHGIVESMGGEIVAESQPTRGTTFKVYLPLAEQRVEAVVGV